MSKLFYSSESNTSILTMVPEPEDTVEINSVDVYEPSETDLIITDIENHQDAIEEGTTYTNIMMETYDAIAKEDVGSDSYKAVCALSQRVLLSLPARLNLRRSLSIPSIEDVSFRYDVYDRIAKESIFESIKKAVKKIWEMIVGLFTSILNFFKRLFGIEIKKKEEERKAIQDRINEILKNKNQYRSNGGTFTGKRFVQILGMSKDDIVKQGNITNSILKLKDRVKYDDAKQTLTKMNSVKVFDYYDTLINVAKRISNINGNALTEKNFLEKIDTIFNINVNLSYSTFLTPESKLTIDTKKLSGSKDSYDDLINAINTDKLAKFEGKTEDSVFSLETDINNINKINEVFTHIISETKELFDQGTKISESILKNTNAIADVLKKDTTKADNLVPVDHDIDYIKSAIAFMNKFYAKIFSQEGNMASAITNELKYVNDFNSELSTYLNDCLDTFKPAN